MTVLDSSCRFDHSGVGSLWVVSEDAGERYIIGESGQVGEPGMAVRALRRLMSSKEVSGREPG